MRPTRNKIAMRRATATRLVRSGCIVAALCLSLAGCTCAGAGRDSAASTCDAYVAVWSGRDPDLAVVDTPAAKRLAPANLVICGAVYSDSDALCWRAMGRGAGPVGACLQTRALFHELRAYPGKPSLMFTEFEWQRTRGVPALTHFADALQQALRSGSMEDCERVGDGASICRAYMTLDTSQCTVAGHLAEMAFSLPDHKEGEPSTYTVKEVTEASCRETINSRAFLSQGLEHLAASGPARERELARAALRRRDACAPLMQEARERCVSAAETAAAPGPSLHPGSRAADDARAPG
jgi:hypothetical protein